MAIRDIVSKVMIHYQGCPVKRDIEKDKRFADASKRGIQRMSCRVGWASRVRLMIHHDECRQ